MQLLRANTENFKNSDSGNTNNSKDTGILGGMFGKQVLKQDWREYFGDEELDKAYQIVEVEQRDEADDS